MLTLFSMSLLCSITVEFSDLTCDGDLDGDDSDFDVDDIELESQDASFFLTMDVYVLHFLLMCCFCKNKTNSNLFHLYVMYT